jgi:hypothetical protein
MPAGRGFESLADAGKAMPAGRGFESVSPFRSLGNTRRTLAHGIIICNRRATKDLAMAAGRGFESLADASIIICNRRATKDLAMPAGQGNASREGL